MLEQLRADNERLIKELASATKSLAGAEEKAASARALHTTQVDNLQAIVDREAKAAASAQQEVHRFRSTVSQLTAKYEELEAIHTGLETEHRRAMVARYGDGVTRYQH